MKLVLAVTRELSTIFYNKKKENSILSKAILNSNKIAIYVSDIYVYANND